MIATCGHGLFTRLQSIGKESFRELSSRENEMGQSTASVGAHVKQNAKRLQQRRTGAISPSDQEGRAAVQVPPCWARGCQLLTSTLQLGNTPPLKYTPGSARAVCVWPMLYSCFAFDIFSLYTIIKYISQSTPRRGQQQSTCIYTICIEILYRSLWQYKDRLYINMTFI